MSIAQVYKSEQILDYRIGEGTLDFGWREIVTIDVPADARSCEKFHIVRASEQAHVIDLRDAWYKELDCAGDQVLISTASEGIVESTIDLIEVEVIRSCTRGSPTLFLTAGMNCFDKLIDLLASKEAGLTLATGSNIKYADTVVCIEHRDGIVWANC